MFEGLSQTISKFAPLLGGALAGPAGAAVAGLVASAFGGDASQPDELVDMISADPDAAVKLQELQLNNKLELQKLVLQHAALEIESQKIQAADVANAREQNAKTTKIVDEFIKIYLVIVISAVIFYCLYAVVAGSVEGQEYAIIISVLSSAVTIVISIVSFYWGGVIANGRKDSEKVNNIAHLPFPDMLTPKKLAA